MSRTDPPGCTIRTVKYGDRHQPAIVFACSVCKAEQAERFSGERFSPDFAAKRTRRQGWIVEPDRTGANFCPRCIIARRERAPTDTLSQPTEGKPMNEPKAELKAAARPLPAAPDAPAPPAVLRQPTQQERMKIRNALDGHFDDSAGCYLQGFSDQSIGEKLNVPWAMVAAIREAAYGPIKIDPELSGIRAELAGLGAKIEHLVRDQQHAIARVAAFEKKRRMP